MNPIHVNLILASFTVVAQIVSILILISVVFPKSKAVPEKYMRLIREKGVLFSGIVALVASVGSLLYSNGFGYAPCVLCWIQRICMYPLAFLLLGAYVRKDARMHFYAITMAIVGAIVGFYNHLLQMGLNPLNLACGADGSNTISCAKVFVFEFGYITMPLMSVTAFLFITVLLLPSAVRRPN